MKITEYARQLKETLGHLFGEEAAPLSDILLCNVLDTDKSGLILRGDEEITEEAVMSVDEAVNQLGFGVPVQYIVGNCWFYGRKIKVGKGVFIPRSDTEVLVETASHCIPQGGSFADICTGSGCISAALASVRGDLTGYALDISHKALGYAEENLADFPQITVRRFDALDEDDYASLELQAGKKLDAVLCNPPYIRSEEIDFLQQQVQYEPHNALDGGPDGLRYYRTVTALASGILAENGFLIFEMGYGQASDIAAIMNENGFETATVKDLNGIERVILGKQTADRRQKNIDNGKEAY